MTTITKHVVNSSRANRHGRFHLSVLRWMLTLSAILGISILLSASARASDVLLITKAGQLSNYIDQINAAAQFYGLAIESVSIADAVESSKAAKALNAPDLTAVILSASALDLLNQESILRSLKRPNGSRIPLLIVVDSPSSNSQALSRWTENRITGCPEYSDRGEPWQLTFGSAPAILHQLSGLTIKASTGPICELVHADFDPKVALATARASSDRFVSFVDVSSGPQPEFVIAPIRADFAGRPGDMAQFQETFARTAGFMIFLQYAAKDRAWHLPGRFANMTIDDPWLAEPYGNLQYRALLDEMEKHNFHTTIAFVPWNFDRNDSKMIELFLEHKDRYSISVHGNNHNHQEFGDYRTRPLSGQTADAGQALARMEKFTEKTGIPYDRVMVFPHAIAPAETLKILRTDRYWATVNSENVPLGSTAPSEPLFVLRPWTLFYNEFLSLRRTSAEVPVRNANIAINAFLGNPQLFYVHQEVFEKGIDAFNPVADEVNRLEPAVKWTGLGDIVKHLYLVRARLDSDYDVMALSPILQLENPTSRRMIFHVRKPGDSDARGITLDGAAIPFAKTNGELHFDVVMEPNQHRNIEVMYGDAVNLAAVDTTKRSLAVACDRHLSDFRDRILSRSPAGQRIQFLYYKYGAARTLMFIAPFAAIFIVILCVLLARLVAARRKHAAEQRNVASRIGAL
jgi:hypothetical protein